MDLYTTSVKLVYRLHFFVPQNVNSLHPGTVAVQAGLIILHTSCWTTSFAKFWIKRNKPDLYEVFFVYLDYS